MIYYNIFRSRVFDKLKTTKNLKQHCNYTQTASADLGDCLPLCKTQKDPLVQLVHMLIIYTDMADNHNVGMIGTPLH